MSKICCPVQPTDFTKEKREAQRVEFSVSWDSWRAQQCPFSFSIFLYCWYLFFIKLPSSKIYVYFPIILILFPIFLYLPPLRSPLSHLFSGSHWNLSIGTSSPQISRCRLLSNEKKIIITQLLNYLRSHDYKHSLITTYLNQTLTPVVQFSLSNIYLGRHSPWQI